MQIWAQDHKGCIKTRTGDVQNEKAAIKLIPLKIKEEITLHYPIVHHEDTRVTSSGSKGLHEHRISSHLLIWHSFFIFCWYTALLYPIASIHVQIFVAKSSVNNINLHCLLSCLSLNNGMAAAWSDHSPYPNRLSLMVSQTVPVWLILDCWWYYWMIPQTNNKGSRFLLRRSYTDTISFFLATDLVVVVCLHVKWLRIHPSFFLPMNTWSWPDIETTSKVCQGLKLQVNKSPCRSVYLSLFHAIAVQPI